MPLHPLRACAPLLAVVMISHTASAQLGHASGIRIDVQKRIAAIFGPGHTDFYGVARDDLDNYWVTAKRATAATAHQLFRFAAGGAFLGSYDQPAATSASATGILDLAYDSTANALYGSCETGVSGSKVFGFDIATTTWTSALDWKVPAAYPGASVRGLTLDPYASGGPSLYASDLSSAVVEFKKDGTLVRTIPNPVPSCTGIAIDPLYRKLWFVGQSGSTRPNTGVVAVQVDVTSGQKTGLVMLGDMSVTGTPMGGVSGGLEFGIHVHTDHIEPFLLFLSQATSDTIYELDARFNFGANCGGIIGFKNDAPYWGNAQWTVTLRGSSSANAFLLVNFANVVMPLAPPLFGMNCTLQVGLNPPPIAIGPYPVTGSSAEVMLPIPNGVTGEVWFQWLEVSNPIAPPLLLSDGSGTVIWP